MHADIFRIGHAAYTGVNAQVYTTGMIRTVRELAARGVTYTAAWVAVAHALAGEFTVVQTPFGVVELTKLEERQQ
jgi:hypothetical protein